MKRKKRKMKLFTMLIVLSVLPMVVSILIVSTTSLYLTRTNLEEASRQSLYIVANNLAKHCNQNKISFATAEKYHDYIDSLQDQKIEMAILLEDSPSVTSIKNENGYRVREIEVDENVIHEVQELGKEYYDSHVVIDNKAYYAYYMPITVDDKIVGMAFAAELQTKVTDGTTSIVISFVSVAVVLLVLFTILTILISRKILKAFGAINNNIESLSKGNLGTQKQKFSSIKELNNLLLAAKLMQENLSRTIGNVKEVSQKLIENIVSVTTLSESNYRGANNITTTMKELSTSTIGLTKNVQDIHDQMQEIGICISDITENVENLYRSSECILQASDEANGNMSAIYNNSKKSLNAVNDITTQINETNDSITEINKAVALIISLSDQTKLLSLNASIEAARAGDMGKGFAVVAEEIRNLSDQSADGAEMIKGLAEVIIKKSQKSVQLADEVHTLMMTEQDSVTKTQMKFEELSKDINQSVNEIKSIAEKTENLTNYKVRVIDNVQNLSAISQENAASNEEVNNNIYNIITDVQTVNEKCEKMSIMAKELEESISYFYSEG